MKKKKTRSEKTYRFRPLKEPNRYQVMVYEPGVKGLSYWYFIKLITNAHGVTQIHCNCPANQFAKRPAEMMCVHKKEFLKYMEQFVPEEKVSI